MHLSHRHHFKSSFLPLWMENMTNQTNERILNMECLSSCSNILWKYAISQCHIWKWCGLGFLETAISDTKCWIIVNNKAYIYEHENEKGQGWRRKMLFRFECRVASDEYLWVCIHGYAEQMCQNIFYRPTRKDKKWHETMGYSYQLTTFDKMYNTTMFVLYNNDRL